MALAQLTDDFDKLFSFSVVANITNCFCQLRNGPRVVLSPSKRWRTVAISVLAATKALAPPFF